jgi:hypothetical protein
MFPGFLTIFIPILWHLRFFYKIWYKKIVVGMLVDGNNWWRYDYSAKKAKRILVNGIS